MNKNYLVGGAIVLVVLLAGVGYVFRHQIKQLFVPSAAPSQVAVPSQTSTSPEAPAASTPTQQTMQAVEVDYTTKGFSPATVTIKKGQTVRFVNKWSLEASATKTGGQMSVASNPHPTHTDYPGFDQGKSSSQGMIEYSFTFDKVGTWGYHNHLNASDTGTVVVTE